MMNRKRLSARGCAAQLLKRAVVLAAFALLPALATAQDSAGAVRIASTSFDPALIMYPHFFPSADGREGMVETARVIPVPAEASAGAEAYANRLEPIRSLAVYTLRADQYWRDGTPITAYDAYWGYRLRQQTERDDPPIGNQLLDASGSPYSFIPVDERTLVFLSPLADCGALEAVADFPLVPAHLVSATFAESARAAFAGIDLNDAAALLAAEQAWLATRPRLPSADVRDRALLAAAPRGQAIFDPVIIDESRYFFDGLPIAVPNAGSTVEAFMSGDLDILINPVTDRRPDVRALPGVQIAEPVGRTWYALAFNFADPARPRPAFDDETGESLDQGVHPVLGDPAVREAIAMTLDLNAIGTAATNGHFALVSDPEVPWLPQAADHAAAFDLFAAGELLEANGWGDWNRDGIRECHGCATAEEGDRLAIRLMYGSTGAAANIAARLIAAQLRAIGMDVQTENLGAPLLFDVLEEQAFDFYLLEMVERGLFPSSRAQLFTRAQDRPYALRFANVHSYSSDAAEAALARAAAAPMCDLAVREAALAEAYGQVLADRALIPLFTEREFYAAQPAVIGFAPRGHDPFWNLEQWRLNR